MTEKISKVWKMENEIKNMPSLQNLPSRERLLELLLAVLPELSDMIGQQKEVVTLRVFAEEYSNLIKQNRSTAYYNSVTISLKHFTDFFGLQRSIQSIGLKEVESFISHLQQKVNKGYRVYVRTLKAAFNKAIDWGYIKDNYFIKVKLPKKQKVNPAYIDERQLLLICQKIDVDVVKEISILGFYTGMRLNELVNLTWRNVNLTTRIITVGDEDFTTKGRNQRYIPICDEAFEVLSKRIPKVHIVHNDKSYVFCKTNGLPFTGDFISKRFKSACKAAGTDKAIHFHSLRHSFASNLAQKGVSLYTIKELLGHSSISTTEIYSHLNMDSLKEAIGKFNSPHPNLLPMGEGIKQQQIIRINSGEAK
jgi:site-specific recombinase XerD